MCRRRSLLLYLLLPLLMLLWLLPTAFDAHSLVAVIVCV